MAIALLLSCLILSGLPLSASPQAEGSGPGLTADQWSEQARELARRGVVFEAMSAYERAVRTEPGRLDIRLEYAKLLKTMGFWLRSAGQYRYVLAQRPKYIEALLGYGELLLAEYQFASAIEEFSRVLDMNPSTMQKEQALVGIGSGQFGLEDYVGASETFERLLEEVPGSPAGTAFLALTKRKQGELEEAVELLNQFLERNPGVNRARIDRIEIQEQMAAINQARQAAENDRGNAARWARLGDLKREQPDLAGARAAYARASELKPREARYRYLMALVLRDMGLWKEAARVFSSIVDDPRYGTTAAYNLAYCEGRAGDRDAETEAWALVVERHPLDIDSYRRYIVALARTEGLDLEAARVRRSISEAEKAGHNDPLPYLKKAIIAQQSGELESATDAVLSAVAADVNDVRSLTLLRGNLKGNEKAIDDLLERLEPLDEDPDQAERLTALRAKGGVLLAAGRLSEAQAELRKALELEPADAPTMVAIASCLREADRASEAIGILEEAVKADPDYIYAHLDLALTLMKARLWERSIEAARRAIRLDPTNPVGYSIAGTSLQAMGRYKEAAEALERAVDLDPLDRIGAPRMILARVYGALGRNRDAINVLTGDVPENPEEIYRLAWQFVKNNYLDRTFNGQDWDAWRNRFEGRLKTEPQALGAIALMLASLDDRNTRLRSHDQTARLLFTPRTTETEFTSTGKALSTSKTIDKRHLEGNVGYIAITNLSDPKLPEQIEEAVEEMKTTEGVILDLRGNQGGADREVPKITGMFVKPGTETGKIITQRGTETVAAEPVDPAAPVENEKQEQEEQEPIIPEDKPIVVLVDRNTASSAENLTASLKESKRAVVVGEKTHGKAAVQVPKLLPGGAMVLVVGAEHADLAGNIYTGVGIDPDLYIKDAAMGDRTDQDESIRKARELITKPKKNSRE